MSARLRAANPPKSRRANKAKHSAGVDKDNGGVGKGNGNAVAGLVDGLLVELFAGLLAQSALPFVCSAALAFQLVSLSLALLLCCLLTVWVFGFALSCLLGFSLANQSAIQAVANMAS